MTVVALALGLIVGNNVQPGAGFEGSPSAEQAAGQDLAVGE